MEESKFVVGEFCYLKSESEKYFRICDISPNDIIDAMGTDGIREPIRKEELEIVTSERTIYDLEEIFERLLNP